MEQAQKMVDEWNAKKKENRKNCGLRCQNCKGVIRFAKNDYLKKPCCVSCHKVRGSYEFKARADVYKMNDAGIWKQIKSLKNI